MRLLLTGATGFLGRHIVQALFEGRPDVEVDLVVRPRQGETARQRVARVLPGLSPDARLRVLEGRLDRPRFDLDDGEYRDLCDRVDRVLHGAANVRFDQDLDAARQANVHVTRRVLEFALDAGVQRLDHISTCFVAGGRTDRVMERELAHGAGFKNTYERSKYEAELLLREASDGLDLTVYRPSIVVGHSETGVTSSFHMIYWPMKLYSRGWWRTLVARPDTPVDVVPVDFVARAIAHLLDAPGAAGQTFHLAAGPGRHCCVAELAEMTRRAVGGPPVRFIDPDTFLRWVQPVLDPLLFTRKGRAIKRGGHIYLPYFTANPTFDTTGADAALAQAGLVPPRVGEYFGKLIEYALETDFGRRAGPRT